MKLQNHETTVVGQEVKIYDTFKKWFIQIGAGVTQWLAC